MRLFIISVILIFAALPANAQTKRIVALGDSLTAGYGLQSGEDFASRLQAALIAEKLDVKVENAGVSGDTTAGGLSRLAWAIEGNPAPDLVIVALGANDMLRGIDPKVSQDNLGKILATLKEKKIPAMLIGMKSPTNMGPLFQSKFDKIYETLSEKYDVPLYPFFLKDVAMKRDLNLPDGMHPNAKGIDIIAKNIAPDVEDALE